MTDGNVRNGAKESVGPHPLQSLLRFFRTPKGLLTIIMVMLVIPAALGEGLAQAAFAVGVAVSAAMLVDAPILRIRDGEWIFPSGALLTGAIVAMILSPFEPWYVGAVTAAIAVLSKYLFRVGNANVFNPAALGIVATFYMFDTEQNWWGALPEITPYALVLLFATGIFISQRTNKLPSVVAFVTLYYLLFTVVAFAGDPARVAELYRAPDLHAALYFAFFMVTDPPTSPPKPRDQWLFGAITAVVAFVVFEFFGVLYFLLAGVLAANVWEGWRRWRLKTRRRFGSASGIL